MDSMECPKCQSAMAEHTLSTLSGGVTVDKCSACSGIWFDLGEAELLKEKWMSDHIDDGDLVVVERRETANDGDIVVAILEDEEATLKRFYRESNGMIRLQPANSEMEPLFTNRVQLRGVVRGVVRNYR